MSSSTPQQLMEECGLLFQIILKPQRDLGSLLLPVARECGCALRWHNTCEIWIKVRLKELWFFFAFFQWTIRCRNAILTNEEITVCRAGLETLYSYRGRLNWKLSYAQILHLTSNFNLKISADRLWMPKEWGAAIKKALETHSTLLMIPTTGIQAADIISKAMNQKLMGNSILSYMHSIF